MLVIVIVLMLMVLMVRAVTVMVVAKMIEKRGLIECLQYEKFASFCNSILHMVTPA